MRGALRSNERKLNLSKPNTNFLKQSFSYQGTASWNKLPNEILEEHEHLLLNRFKRLIKNYLESENFSNAYLHRRYAMFYFN